MSLIKKSLGLGLVLSSTLLAACDTVDDIPKVPAPSAVVIQNGEVKEGGDCAGLSPWGYPHPASGETLKIKQFICHQDYAILYNSSSGVSDWVVEKITPEKINSDLKFLKPDFRPDPALLDGVAISPNEYNISNKKGWVKGQLTGVGDYRYTKKSQSQSYYMTNVSPMNPYMHDNVYGELNKNIRNWVNSYGDLYVITGPIYYQGKPLDFVGNKAISALVVEGGVAKLGESGKARIAVPTHYYKVIFSPKLKQTMVYIVPNQPFHPSQLINYKTSLRNVELISGYQFFNQLPTDFKNQLSNQIANWPLKIGIVEKD